MTATTESARADDVSAAPTRAIAWRVELAWLAATMLVAVLVAVWVLRLWTARLHVPFWGLENDAAFSLMTVKDTITSTWVQFNDRLGAPYGQSMLDFSAISGDNLRYLLLKAFTPVSQDVAAVTNAYYLLTFALTSGTAFVVQRVLAISRPVAALCAVLFAVLPYHFLRGEMHLMLVAYEAVPLSALLILSVLLGRPRLRRRPGGGLRAWATPTTLITLVCCVVIASSSLYYAVFTMMLLVLAAPIAAVATGDRRRLYEGAALTVAILGVLTFNLAPNIIDQLAHGANPAVAGRAPQESEIYSLNLAHLVLPTSGHRLKPLAELEQRHLTTSPLPSGSMATLGVIGTLGLGLGFVLVVAGALRGRALSERWRLAQAAGLAALLAFLIATTGGISALFAYIVTPQIRGWDRMSVFIAFFSLVVVGVLLDAMRQRLVLRRHGPWLAGAALVAIGVVGVLDQTSPTFARDQDQINAEWTSDARFVKAIEQRLPNDAEVFQLPYQSFPEAPLVANMKSSYELVRGYLHSNRLRFSWGAMNGRPADWSHALADAAPDDVLASAAAAGFQGLWIDRAGYLDQGAGIEAVARRLTGSQPLVSENGRLVFYDLRPYLEALRRRAGAQAVTALGQVTLHPDAITWGAGFAAPEVAGADVTLGMGPAGGFSITSGPGAERSVVVSATLTSDKPGTVVFGWPDGTTQTLRTGSKPVSLRRALQLRPGENPVSVTTDAAASSGAPPGAPDVRLRIVDPIVTTADALPALLAD